MSNASALFQSLLVYGLCLPLAVALGYLLATPLDPGTMAAVGIVLFILLIPLLLRWHHAWLIATWNMSAVLFFVPGRPQVWMGMAGISLLIGVLQSAINRDFKFLHVPSVTRPLLFLLAVILITARARGGIGLRAFGSEVQGGRNYVFLVAAILGYFALTTRRIPPKRAALYLTLFCLGFATMAIGELPRVLPSAFNLLFLVFPVMGGSFLDQNAVVGPAGGTERIGGLSALGMGLFFTMLVRYGIRGILLEPGKSWRVVILAASFLVALMSGFRSAFILMVMIFALLFYLERLHRTRLLPVLVIAAFLAGTLTIAFAHRLPFWVQRSLAFLPVDIDPMARASAQSSSEWRLEMWRDVLPDVPQYLILGKGYGFNARDMYFAANVNRGGSGLAELAGDYHNGPLSVIIPFGIFGMLGFLWFLWAALRAIYRNYQFGDPAYRSFNAFLLACFGVKILFFFLIFGGFASGLMEFTGLVGLSVSLNGGVAKPAVAPQPNVVFHPIKLHPGVRRPTHV